MARHAVWKGYLRLSLVNCAVALYPATTEATRIHFHKLNRETGHRLKIHMVDEETGEEVPTDRQARGYEVAKGRSVIIEPEDIDKLALESTHVMEITEFTARRDIDPLYFDRPYFLIPDDKASAEAFAVIREAMQQRKVAALSKLVMHEREHILLLEPRGNGIVATLLHWPYEMRDEAEIMAEVPAPPKITADLLDVASDLIDRKMGKFDPAKFKDRYEAALKELVEAKRAGKRLVAPKPTSATTGSEVFEALRASLLEAGHESASKRRVLGRKGGRRTSASSSAARTKPAARKTSSRR
ncbi:MAG TPA: Ku protein [Lichenihabitans sp.]|jgi:DNA end-binding protein Ku|nr:Ku protein [Lichenihabitans sp.]